MRTTATISIDHETLEDLDAFGQRHGLKRGASIRELLKIAAENLTEVGTPRAAAPNVGSGRLRTGEPLPAGVQRGVVATQLRSGERVVDPFTGDGS